MLPSSRKQRGGCEESCYPWKSCRHQAPLAKDRRGLEHSLPADEETRDEMSEWDLLLTNARFATMEPGGDPYGALEGAAMAVREGKIAWLGPQDVLPQAKARTTIDLEGRWVTPGLIDCHTHLVHGGDRAAEFELRLKGATYEEIARAGGGIISTVGATRAASEEELFERVADVFLIVDDQNLQVPPSLSPLLAIRGSAAVNEVPSASVDRTSTVPP